MDVQIPHAIKDPRQIVAFTAKKNKLKAAATKKLFAFVFGENKSPDKGQCLTLIKKYKP